MQPNKVLKAVFKDPWPYWVGAVLLAVLNISLLAFSGSPWGVTTPLAIWGAWLYQAVGGHPEQWSFFQDPANAKALAGGFLNHAGSIQNVGIIVGAFLATLLASEFKIKRIKSFRQVVGAVAGGLMMGYGARVALGCNVGAFFSGLSSMSLSGWVYLVFIMVGAYIGSKLLVRYLL